MDISVFATQVARGYPGIVALRGNNRPLQCSENEIAAVLPELLYRQSVPTHCCAPLAMCSRSGRDSFRAICGLDSAARQSRAHAVSDLLQLRQLAVEETRVSWFPSSGGLQDSFLGITDLSAQSADKAGFAGDTLHLWVPGN